MMKLSERVFNIIDRSREFIEIRCGVDLLAIAELPPLNETLGFLSAEASKAREEIAKIESQNTALLGVVRDCVNFLADLDTKSDRAKALHKRAYTAHSKATGG